MMFAETTRDFDALERQAAKLTDLFRAAGYERVAPDLIQPADIFLDRVGEAIRGRTYVFTDMDGNELCLRPDLTIPVARLYMERHPECDVQAGYCYNGPAFRHQADPADILRPREFRQAGVEDFGRTDREAAEVDVLRLVLDGLGAAGLIDYNLHVGDLGLFRALLDTLDMPERWRQRLLGNFWRPDRFSGLLHELASGDTAERRAEDSLARRLDADAPDDAEALVGAYLDEHGLPLIGVRSLPEVATRLLHRAADLNEAPLPREQVSFIEAYLAVSGPPRAALARIEDLLDTAGLRLRGALESYRRRCDLLASAGIDLGRVMFSADFGRSFEYYTGFVFQIELPGAGPAGQIAGGGRYDGLLREIGAPGDVPAVGSAIHTERLLAAVSGRLQ